MATIDATAPARQPIAAHRLFRPLVALWFGALLGLGSLAVRPVLLEQLVLDLGIDAIIPAAAPPLGTTFRILMALSLGGLGAVLGGIVAHGMHRAAVAGRELQPRRSRDSHPDAPPRRPISAREEFDADVAVETGTAAEASGPVRRRPLALGDDATGPSEFLDDAPLPGGAPDFDFDAGARLEQWAEQRNAGEPVPAATIDSPADEASEGPLFAPPQNELHENDQHLPFARPAELPEAPLAVDAAEQAERLEVSAASPTPLHGAVTGEAASAADRLAKRPLEQLSTAELSERLAIALDARRRRAAASVAQPTAKALPAALRPIDLTPEDDGTSDPFDDALAAPVVQAWSGVDADELDDDTLEDGYSSLLDLTRPAPRSLAESPEPVVDEPVVTFPGLAARRSAGATALSSAQLRRFDAPTADEAAARAASPRTGPALDRSEADKALRAALATLQRMSGAA